MNFSFKIKINNGKQKFVGLYNLAFRDKGRYKYVINTTRDLKLILKKYLGIFDSIYLVNFFRFRKLTRLEIECGKDIKEIVGAFFESEMNKILYKDELTNTDSFSKIPKYFGEYWSFDPPLEIKKDYFFNPTDSLFPKILPKELPSFISFE